MVKTRVRGAFDPITMGFILAIAGVIAAVSLDGKPPTESLESQESTVATELVE